MDIQENLLELLPLRRASALKVTILLVNRVAQPFGKGAWLRQYEHSLNYRFSYGIAINLISLRKAILNPVLRQVFRMFLALNNHWARRGW